MRIISSIGLGFVMLAGLAACGKSDDAIRTQARTQLAANCPRAATPDVTARLAQEGVTIDQVCTCAVDRYLQGATVAQIREDSASPAPPRISAVTAQCVTELVTAAHANSVQPANEAAPAPAEPAAANEAGEAAGEASDADQ
jgi:hypothetical protein